MKNFKTFQREVNFGKNIYLFFIFVVLVLYIFFSFIAVNLKEYKKANTQLKKIKSESILQNDEYNELWDNFNKKTKDNSRTLKSIASIYNEVEISKLLNQYFTTFELSQQNSSQMKNYRILDIQIKSTTTTPKNFYLFAKNLSKINALIEIVHPLEFESKDGYLNINFNLKVYTFE